MEKINFINGETPINDTNLNQMQDNMENAIDTITTETEEKIPNVIDNLESTSTTEALSAKQGKILNEKIDDIIGDIGSISCAGTDAVTTTEEVEIGSGTIEKAGKYLIGASIPINYYGQVGRQLILKLKINEQEVWTGGGVINSSVYVLYTQLTKIVNIPENANVKVTLIDTAGQTFACLPFMLEYIRLK